MSNKTYWNDNNALSFATVIILIILNTLTIHVFNSFAGGVQSISYQSSPEDVVKRFCKLDGAGLRLSSDSRREIEPLLAWGEEGGYDEMVVIKDFKVNKAIIEKSKSSVVVDFFVLGSTDTFEFHKSKNRQNRINFNLLKEDGQWKIVSPIIAPHVQWENAIDHLKLLQKYEPSRKKQLDTIIKKIEQAAR